MSALSVVGSHAPLPSRHVTSGVLVAPVSPSVATPSGGATDTVSLCASPASASSPAPLAVSPSPAPPAVETASPATLSGRNPLPRVPSDVEKGVKRFEKGFLGTPKEPTALHGLVYQRYEDGHVTVLKHAWETTPGVPCSGPDIPSDAVRNNRVFIYVDGIHQSLADQQDQMHRLFQAPRDNPKHGAAIDQPAIGIHEAAGINAGLDGARIAADLTWLKALQGGYLPTSWIEKGAFRTDAAVRSVHNEVRQSLEAGRDVQIALHSGGGAETALALTLLAKEGGGRWKNAIAEHVRVLALSPAAAVKDFELAGVKADNIYYTASTKDPLYRLAHKYVAPWQMPLLAVRAVSVGISLLFNHDVLPYHSHDYIFWRNMQPNGEQPIQTYLDGGRGGEHVVT